MNEKYMKAIEESKSTEPLTQLRGYMVIKSGLDAGSFAASHRPASVVISDDEKVAIDRADRQWNADCGFFMKLIDAQGAKVRQYKANAYPMTAKQCDALNAIINRVLPLLEIAQ